MMKLEEETFGSFRSCNDVCIDCFENLNLPSCISCYKLVGEDEYAAIIALLLQYALFCREGAEHGESLKDNSQITRIS